MGERRSTSDQLHAEADRLSAKPNEVLNPARTLARREEAASQPVSTRTAPAPAADPVKFTGGGRSGTATPPEDMLRRHRSK